MGRKLPGLDAFPVSGYIFCWPISTLRSSSRKDLMELESRRYICIHGHFYQPPRENPWLEEIEVQESAHPWHDWNQRITEECYAPNSEARVLDGNGWIAEIINNYEHISFDFGPTLLRWLEEKAPETYQAILDADKQSCRERNGHGNAIAQAYHHLIMPLATRADKITEVIWGIEDFRQRFQRDPEGMWLPETAVDMETLDILAQHGILFTILAPGQAARFRVAGEAFTEPERGSIDPTRPYFVNLPGNRSVAIFFYDGLTSQAVAFEGLLNSGESLKDRLLAGFSDERPWPQLVHIATDGESYGHHHRFGEMALAYCLDQLMKDPSVRITNYGEYLALHPPTVEVEIYERSSWSCAHGVGRWSEDCGCHVENKAGWDQRWRKPLRQAMDLIRNRVDPIFMREGSRVLKRPWEARDDYIRVVLDRHLDVSEFFAVHGAGEPGPHDTVLALELLEMQRNRMNMYTSCGWFFDDLSGIETSQILRYAARVIQLATRFDEQLETDFVAILADARSNRRDRITGDQIYWNWIKGQVTDLAKVAAHMTVASVFGLISVNGRIYCYNVKVEDSTREEFGERILVVRRMTVQHGLTGETRHFVAALIYFGGVDFRCSVKEFKDMDSYSAMKGDLLDACWGPSSTELTRRLDHYFPGDYFSLHHLFVEERARVVRTVTKKMYEEQAALFEAFYRKHREFAKLIMSEEAPIPDTFLAAAQFVLNRNFLAELEKLGQGHFPDELALILEEARLWKITLDTRAAENLISHRLLELVKQLAQDPSDTTYPEEIIRFLDLCSYLELPINLGSSQIVFFKIIRAIEAVNGAALPLRFPELAQRLAVRLKTGP